MTCVIMVTTMRVSEKTQWRLKKVVVERSGTVRSVVGIPDHEGITMEQVVVYLLLVAGF